MGLDIGRTRRVSDRLKPLAIEAIDEEEDGVSILDPDVGIEPFMDIDVDASEGNEDTRDG